MTTQSIPTAIQQKNIESFVYGWNNGELKTVGIATIRIAKKLLKRFGDWIYENNQENYFSVVGCIEWHYANKNQWK